MIKTNVGQLSAVLRREIFQNIVEIFLLWHCVKNGEKDFKLDKYEMKLKLDVQLFFDFWSKQSNFLFKAGKNREKPAKINKQSGVKFWLIWKKNMDLSRIHLAAQITKRIGAKFLFNFSLSELLTNIFNCLYNNDVIAQEGFEAWLDCSEVSEQEGKGVAIKSTTHFFTWMRENEVDDEEPWIVLKI